MKKLIVSLFLIGSLAAGLNGWASEIRQTISLDKGWHFKLGWFDVPGRTAIHDWRHQFDGDGEASAGKMAAAGLRNASCGPFTLEKYRIKVKPYEFDFTIRIR